MKEDGNEQYEYAVAAVRDGYIVSTCHIKFHELALSLYVRPEV